MPGSFLGVPKWYNRTPDRPEPSVRKYFRLRRSPVFVRCLFRIFLSRAALEIRLGRNGTDDMRLESTPGWLNRLAERSRGCLESRDRRTWGAEPRCVTDMT